MSGKYPTSVPKAERARVTGAKTEAKARGEGSVTTMRSGVTTRVTGKLAARKNGRTRTGKKVVEEAAAGTREVGEKPITARAKEITSDLVNGQMSHPEKLLGYRSRRLHLPLVKDLSACHN